MAPEALPAPEARFDFFASQRCKIAHNSIICRRLRRASAGIFKKSIATQFWRRYDEDTDQIRESGTVDSPLAVSRGVCVPILC